MNHGPWEESIIYDTVRLTRELKSSQDYKRGPVMKDSKELKYLMQDVIITYRALEKACSDDYILWLINHCQPIHMPPSLLFGQ